MNRRGSAWGCAWLCLGARVRDPQHSPRPTKLEPGFPIAPPPGGCGSWLVSRSRRNRQPPRNRERSARWNRRLPGGLPAILRLPWGAGRGEQAPSTARVVSLIRALRKRLCGSSCADVKDQPAGLPAVRQNFRGGGVRPKRCIIYYRVQAPSNYISPHFLLAAGGPVWDAQPGPL